MVLLEFEHDEEPHGYNVGPAQSLVTYTVGL